MMQSMSKPVVFACSGCSPASSPTSSPSNWTGATSPRDVLAGLGAEKPVFMKLAERRPVWIIDGCPIECGEGISAKVGRPDNYHLRLHNLGIKKKEGLLDSMTLDDLVAWAQAEAARA